MKVEDVEGTVIEMHETAVEFVQTYSKSMVGLHRLLAHIMKTAEKALSEMRNEIANQNK